MANLKQRLHKKNSSGYDTVWLETSSDLVMMSGGTTTLTNKINTTDLHVRSGSSIPSNSDLNNYTTPGEYYVPSSAVAETITNTPITTSGYRLSVCQPYSTSYKRQIARGSGTTSIYVRTYISSWSSWNKIAFKSELEDLKTSVSEGKALVAAAVTDKGVTTAADASFSTIATNIGKIKGGNSGVAIINVYAEPGVYINCNERFRYIISG